MWVETVTVWVPGDPVAQGSMRSLGPRRIVSGNADRIAEYRAMVRRAILDMPVRQAMVMDPARLVVTFVVKRPKSAKAGALPAKTPDLDKYVRACCDALTQAGVWSDDKLMVSLRADKVYEGPGQAVGTYLTVLEWR